MKIRIIVVGKIKEKYIRAGVKEYIKRLSRYCSIEIIEVENKIQNDIFPWVNEDYIVRANI